MKARDWIRTANERVSFAALLRRLDVYCPDLDPESSLKVNCPWGWLHIDGGVEKSMRVYGASNSGYCFAEDTYFTPSRLAARAWGTTEVAAAQTLLAEIGWKPPTLTERWVAATAHPTPEIDRAALAEALHAYGRRLTPDWPTLQFTEPLRTVLAEAFRLLDAVSDGDDAERWLTRVKCVVERVVRTHHGARRGTT